MIPVVLISFLYNLPKFFELTVEEVESYDGTFYHLSPTALRYRINLFNPKYIFYTGGQTFPTSSITSCGLIWSSLVLSHMQLL